MKPMKSAVADFMETALGVRPGEGRRTMLLFLHLLLASSVFILGRTVRDTLFLTHYSLKALPWMFVCYGIASAITVVVHSQVADRIARHRLIVISTSIGIATYLATWVAVRAGASFIYPVFYVWSEVVANLFIVQFWILANDLHDARAAKRLFATIGSARVLGVVLVGFGAGAIVTAVGTAQLLFLLAALMAGIAGISFLLKNEPPAEAAARAGAQARRRGAPPRIMGDPYVRALAGIILLTFTALTICDYQFKVIARAAFREDDLARFFSLFYAGTGVISFLFQILVTPRLLARRGVGAGMAVMPAVFGAASAALLFAPRVGVAVVMKFADNGFQYTTHETTLQALYVPFARAVKARTRAFLDAVVKPLSYAAGGLVLILVAPHLNVYRLGLVTLPLVVVWLSLIPVVRRRYLHTLEATLTARGAIALDHETLFDSNGRQALIRTLERGQPRQILLALEHLAEERSEDIRDVLQRLAAHADPAVRAAALDRLGSFAGASPPCVREALRDGVAEVRMAAATAHAALARDEAVDALSALLEDPSRKVRAAALAGLLGRGGVEGGIVGGAHLARLLQSAGADDRIEAAQALESLGPDAYRPLRRLLEDADPRVRRAALKAAPGVADPRLVPLLLEGLRDPACRRRAGVALVAVGLPAIGPLTALVSDGAAPRALKLLAPRLLRRIPRREAYESLRSMASVKDGHMRLRIFAALSHLRHALSLRPEPVETIHRFVESEILETHGHLAGWKGARDLYGTPLLDEVFQVHQTRAVRRILRILELRYDAEALRLVRQHLAEPSRRANALEVLDTLLDPPLRKVVMPFLEALPGGRDPHRAGEGSPPAPTSFVRRLCRHPNPFVALAALDALARRRDPACGEEGAAALAHPEPLIREGGIHAVAAADHGSAAEALRPLLSDPDPVVSRHARAALARLGGAGAPEAPMYSTLEKILFLKTAAVFAKLSGEDLAPLARTAEVETYPPGGTIFSEGELGDALYVIVRGKVAVVRGGEPLATLGAGEALGEMAVLEEEPRSATAVAEEETELLRIGSEEFYEILHEQVEIAEGVIRMLARRLREADALIEKLRPSSAR